MLGLRTRILHDTEFPAKGAKIAPLLGIARAAGADRYLSGPFANSYLDKAAFAAAGITVQWMSYEGT
jgi:hypothetical protein